MGIDMKILRLLVGIIVFLAITSSCHNKKKLEFYPRVDDSYTIEYDGNHFMISNNESCDTFNIYNNEVFDNDKRLFLTTKRDTTIKYNYFHYQISRVIKNIKKDEYECTIFIEDDHQKRFFIFYIYDKGYMIQKIQRTYNVDFTHQ